MSHLNNHMMAVPNALNIASFAEYMETIKTLYEVDDDFKTLCDDYVTCKVKIDVYKSKSLDNLRSELEFQQMSFELEKEIIEYVKRIS